MHSATIKKITAITLGLVAAFGAASAIVWSYSDAKGVWDFWTGPAASWVQAIGSIAAIMASYELGQRSFKNQMQRDKIAELERKRHAYMLLHQVFGYSWGIDSMAAAGQMVPDIWKTVGVGAQDALHVIDSVPMMDIPDPDLLRELTLCRQAMITYRAYGEITADPARMAKHKLENWVKFAQGSAEQSMKARDRCSLEASKIQAEIELSKMNG